MQENTEILKQILERNKRVEADKAWETSNTRRSFIILITYCIACFFLYLIGNTAFWINAMVPAGGYLLSTLSLPPLKRWWMKCFAKAATMNL